MSIATEISRLQTAKADLKTSIEGKGVTVPASAKIDAYPALVDSIQTGGGGITPTGTKQISIMANGTTTEDVTNYANAEITVNVPSGASLPSVISKIDGGSFTFASATTATYHIMHSLGVVPKGFLIWSDSVDLATAGNSAVIRGVFIVDNAAENRVTSYLYQMCVYNGDFNSYVRGVGSNYSAYANENYISYNVSNNKFAAGVEYKWFAFA